MNSDFSSMNFWKSSVWKAGSLTEYKDEHENTLKVKPNIPAIYKVITQNL